MSKLLVRYAPTLGTRPHIAILNSDGTDFTDLTSSFGREEEFHLCFSPTGDKIAFASDFESPDAYSQLRHVYVMDTDGSNVKRISNDGGTGSGVEIFGIDWSPDGRKLVYSQLISGSGYEIRTMKPNGSDIKTIFVGGVEPAWSPDGTKIVFRKVVSPGGLHVMDADGSNVNSLGQSGKNPRWSPDGTKIVAESSANNYQFVVMNADGTNVLNVGSYLYGDGRSAPTWSPDGTKLYYTSNRSTFSGGNGIYAVETQSFSFSNEQRIYPPTVDNTYQYGTPRFAHDFTGEIVHDGQSVCSPPFLYIGNDEAQGRYPISLREGEKREQVTDLNLNTPAGTLSFTRSYRQSKRNTDNDLGLGWTHEHAMSLDDGTSGKLILRLPNGSEAHFAQVGSTDEYVAEPGASGAIDAGGSGSSKYTLTASDKSIYVFDDQGSLRSRTWEYGEEWTYSYYSSGYAAGKLQEVDDGYGRKLQFSYIDAPSEFDDLKLWRVGDHTASGLDGSTPTGRYVEFNYLSEKANGVEVTTPRALLHTVRDVRSTSGNELLWSYDYYGQQSGENAMVLLNAVNEYQSPSVDVDGDEQADGSITLKRLSYGFDVHLAVNGGMEADSDWDAISGAEPQTNERSDAQVDSGSYARHIVANATEQGIIGNSWKMVKDRTYTVTARVYPVSGTVKMQVAGATGVNDTSAGTGAWETLTANITASSDTENHALEFRASGDGAEFYVDSVSIVETNPEVSVITQEQGIFGAGDPLLVTEYLLQPQGEDATLEKTAERVTTHRFANTVHINSEDPLGNVQAQSVGISYRPITQQDANGNEMQLSWSSNGQQLNKIKDALGGETHFSYDGQERLAASINAEGHRTIYLYDETAATKRKPKTIWVTNGANLIGSGNMELDDGWTNIASAAPVANHLSSGQVYGGYRARRVLTDAANEGIESATWSLLAGVRGVVIARVFPVSGTVKMKVSGTTSFDLTTSQVGQWNTLMVAHTPTSDLSDVKLQFTAQGGAAEFYVDEVYVLNSTMIQRWQEFTYDSKGRVLSEKLIDPADGTTSLVETTRTYYTTGNGNGLLESLIQIDVETPANNTATTYSYDSLGRAVKTQKTSLFGTCEFTYTVYDAAGNVVATVCGPQNTTAPADVAAAIAMYDSGDPVKKFNRVTTHEYDTLGRRVKTTTNDGSGNLLKQTTVTLYDALGRVVRTIGNYVVQGASAPGDWIWDAADSRWEDGAGNAVAHGSENNQNIISDTAYNARGLTRLTRDVLGNVTLMGYDDADRLVKTVRSASDPDYNNDYTGVDPDPGLAVYVIALDSPDQDVINQTVYDAAGNPVQTIDARGGITFTVYDALNRPVKVVRNAKAGATIALNSGDPGYAAENDPRSVAYAPSADPDYDQIELTEYDAMGRVIRTRRLLENRDTTAQWDVTLMGYDQLGRQVKTIRAASQPEYSIAADPDLSAYVPSSAADQDILSMTSYTTEGRVLTTADVNGTLTRSVYDGLGRQVRTIASYAANAADPADWVWDAGDNRWEDGVGNAIAHGTDNDQNIISATSFDSDGRVAETIDVAGRKTRHVYDGQGRRIRTIRNYVAQGMSDPADWEWDAGDERWEDGAGGVVAQHSDSGNGKKADINRISDTVYDDHGRVIKTIDHRQNVTLFGYDLVGRRVKTVQNASNPTYDSVADPDLSAYTPSMSPGVDQDRITTSIYDIAGRAASSVDAAGNQMRSIFDALGRQVLMVNNYVSPGGGVNTDPATWLWSDTNQRWEDDAGLAVPHGAQFDQNLISQTVYNQAGQVVATRDARGTQTTFSYDAAGRRLTITAAANSPQAVTSYTCYDKAGRVRRTIANYLPLNDGLGQELSPDARTNNTWDFAPGTHGQYDDQNLITEYLYDALGRRTAVIDALGNTATTVYAKDGQVQAMTDPEGTVTTYRYDKLRRRKLVVQGYMVQGTSDPATWVWDAGQTRWEQSNGTAIVHGSNSDQNIIVQVLYDKLGQMLSLRDPRGNLTQYEYDLLNRRTKLTNPISKDWLTSYEDLLTGGARTSMTYPGINGGSSYTVQRDSDRLGRAASIAYGDPSTTPDVRFTYNADGDRSKMTEYGGASFTNPVRETVYGYDAQHRLISAGFDTDGNGTVEETVIYAYDTGGLKTKLTMPGDLTLEYQYDARGQLIAMTDWDDQQTTFAYDNAGRHIMTKRHNGLRSRYAYDAAGRLRLLRQDAGSKTLAHFAYSVDKRGNRTQALEALRQPGAGTTTIAHDDPEVVYSGSWSVVGDYHETTQTDAKLHLLFFGGQNVTLKMGRGPDHGVYDIYIGKTLWQSIDGYNAGAAERTISIPLDGDGPHLLEIRNRAEQSSSSSGYKLRFKSLAVDGAYTLHTIQYQYDALSRLLSANYRPADNLAATASRAYAYTHDVAGNRLSESLTLNGGMPTVTNYSYNAANQLTGGSIAYDNNGNLTNDGANSYTWDRANRLLSMGGSSYKYAGDGSRIRQTVSSIATDYLLDVQPGLVKVIAQTTGSDTERFIHSPRGIHAMEDAAGVWMYPMQDGLGSVRMEASDALAVDGSQNFAPYGTPFDVNGNFDTSFGFTGEQTDGNELIYLRARYYNPAAGVFTARDPFEGVMGRPMSLNGYSWVEGNVANAIDLSGKSLILSSRLNSGLCSRISLYQFNQPSEELPVILFLGGSYADDNEDFLNEEGFVASISDDGPNPFLQTRAWLERLVDGGDAQFTAGPLEPVACHRLNPNPNGPRCADVAYGPMFWHTTSVKSDVRAHGVIVVRYNGAKERHANAAFIYAIQIQEFQDIFYGSGSEKRPIIVIGYSSGADSALLFAHMNRDELNIRSVTSLGPTFSGAYREVEGGTLSDNETTVLSEILAAGTIIYLVDDSGNSSEDVADVQGESGFTYLDSETIRTEYGITEHFDQYGLGVGTNNNTDLIERVYRDLGIL